MTSVRDVLEGNIISLKLSKYIPKKSGLCIIGGGIGSGKSCLAYGILEYLSVISPNRHIFVYGFPKTKQDKLPVWIRTITNMEFPEDSIVLIDEAYIQFHSRNSSTSINKFIDLFTGLVRQKNIFCIFISQSFRKLDIGILTSAQLVLIKKPPILQVKMDRSELRSILSDSLQDFQAARSSGLDIQSCTYVISNDEDFIGMLYDTNKPPSFWTDDLSRAWKGINLKNTLSDNKKSNKRKSVDINEF